MRGQSLGSWLSIGGVTVPGRVWLAPMTGVSDLAFRRTATNLGASYVATEMVACEQFARGCPDVVQKTAVGDGMPLMVVQLVGREPRWIAEAARPAARAGAHIIDLNFGCPAKEVTGHLSGSALMRDPELAESLVRAAVEAVDVPVTVKMRLGWDDQSRNAPDVAARVQRAGAQAVTVHGRTRNQFYGGRADWTAVREVKNAVNVPVLVNGDIVDVATAREAMRESGADGVMIGRGAIGRPWIARQIEAALAGGTADEPGPPERLRIVTEHLRESVRLGGEVHGLRRFRKHLAAYLDAAPGPSTPPERRQLRSRLCRIESVRALIDELSAVWSGDTMRLAA